MSKTTLATQAPIGTVTSTGWNGCPYGPASAVFGRLACCVLSMLSSSKNSSVLLPSLDDFVVGRQRQLHEATVPGDDHQPSAPRRLRIRTHLSHLLPRHEG